MKKLILLLSIALLLSTSVYCQYITGMYTVPSNPVAGQAVSLVAQVSFPSGTCDQKTVDISVNGNTFAANALHCIGPLTYICNDVDSFYIGVLTAGNYVFSYHVDAGGAPSPCTPGIAPGPTDSISFTVGTAGIDQYTPKNDFAYFINGNNLLIKTGFDAYTAYIYNAAGQKIYTALLKGETEINLNSFSKGIYTVVTFNEERMTHYRFMLL